MRPTERGETSKLRPASERLSGPAALVLALGLGVRAQQLLTRPEYPWDGPIFYALAIVLFLWGLRRWRRAEPWFAVSDGPCHRDVGPGEERGRLPVRVGLGLLAAALAVVAYQGFGDHAFSTVDLLAWLGALATFLVAAGETPPSRVPRRLGDRIRRLVGAIRRWWRRPRLSQTALIVAGIVLVGTFFRLYRLSSVPAEMTSDHAEKLLDVYDVLHGACPVFFPRNTGREAMQFYLTAALIRFTPLALSHLALKVGTAMVSIVTVVFAFLLGRSIYGRRIGFLTAGFVALSRWHVAISRVGLRFPFTPFFSALVLFFLFRAFRHDQRSDWLACGLALGVGLHSYTAVRLLPLLLVVLTVAKTIWDLVERACRANRPTGNAHSAYAEQAALSARFWVNAGLGAAASGLVFLPLLRYMVDEPKMFWYRVLTRMAEAERALPSHPWRVFVANVKDALLMFNYRGGPAWVNTVPGDPVLSCVVGPLFVLGVSLAVWRLFKDGDRRGLYLLLSLLVLLLPTALSVTFPVENPSVVRAGGAIPIVALFAALTMEVTIEGLRSLLDGRSWAVAVISGGIFLAAAGVTYQWYFVTYDRQYREMAWNTTDMGRVVSGFAESVGDMDHAYHIPYPHWADTRNIAINAGDITWRNTVDELGELCEHAKDPAPKLYLLHADDQESLNALRSCFPRGQLRRYQSDIPTRDFLRYFVPGCDQDCSETTSAP